MEIRKIQNAELKDKKVLLRADFNVAVKDGKVKEEFKIKACKESLIYLLSQNAKVAIISHFGRPEGKVNQEFSLGQIAEEVERVLDVKIKFVPDCIGEKVKKELDNFQEGQVLLLENVRFYEGEEKNDGEFSKKLAENFDFFVNDAFSVCHRDQASITGITKSIQNCAGFWLQREIENLEKIKNDPEHPAVAIIGGAKIETKLPLINSFEKSYDNVLIGGKIANEAIDQKIIFSEKVMLPVDFANDRFDIGPETIDNFKIIIANASTIIWNGPMGKFEEPEYARGTEEILDAVMNSGAYTLMGGGESVEILEKKDAMDKISFVSTGGGAMLEYLSGNKMPGIGALVG